MGAKLYFRHGAMGSGKSLLLMAVAHNYEHQGKNVLVLKPSADTRTGKKIGSRAPLERYADFLVKPDEPLWPWLAKDTKYSCVLVDEAQFLSERNVEELRSLTFVPGIPVICYGLRTDFRARLFPGSKRLFELADSIEEIKTTCQFCDSKAVFNLRYRKAWIKDERGKTETISPVVDGPQVELGADDLYMPNCYGCFPHEEIIHRRKDK